MLMAARTRTIVGLRDSDRLVSDLCVAIQGCHSGRPVVDLREKRATRA